MDGKKHWNWKGENIGYISIHSWNNSHYPKSGKCTNCNQHKKTVWALKKGKKHKRGIKNYKELCQSCHIKYDMTEGWTKKSIEALKKTYAHTHPIKDKYCEYCKNKFSPKKKIIRFCSNKCSARGTPRKLGKRDLITGRWLALNNK